MMVRTTVLKDVVMTNEEKIRYLSNIYRVIAADGDLDPDEQQLFRWLAGEIRADAGIQWEARKLAHNEKEVQTQVADRWSDRIRNLEDMMLVAYCDGNVDLAEKQIVVTYAKHLGIKQAHLNLIKEEAQLRLSLRKKLERETQQRLASAPIPYGVDKRPMPRGVDLDQLIPERVGFFQREPISVPQDIHSEIYANYKADGFEIFMELGICDDPAAAQTGVKNAIGCLPHDGEVLAESVGTDPSYHKAKTETGAFLAWTRDGYYFSVHARKGGEQALDAFMEAFPF